MNLHWCRKLILGDVLEDWRSSARQRLNQRWKWNKFSIQTDCRAALGNYRGNCCNFLKRDRLIWLNNQETPTPSELGSLIGKHKRINTQPYRLVSSTGKIKSTERILESSDSPTARRENINRIPFHTPENSKKTSGLKQKRTFTVISSWNENRSHLIAIEATSGFKTEWFTFFNRFTGQKDGGELVPAQNWLGGFE